MVTLSTSQQIAPARGTVSLGYDFALLGLKGREARVDVIRIAAQRTASKIPDTLEVSDRVEMLTELVASTYRLLDPRRRERSLERVQLSLASENDPSLATVGRKPLVPAGAGSCSSDSDPFVVAEIVSPAAASVQLASKVSQDSVSSAGEDTPLRKPNRNSRVGLICISALATVIGSTLLVAWAILN